MMTETVEITVLSLNFNHFIVTQNVKKNHSFRMKDVG